MRTRKLGLQSLLVAIALGALAAAPARAYIDPATGSYVLQMLVAGILGGLFAIKLFWRRIVTGVSDLFRGSSRSQPDSEAESDQDAV